MPERWNVACSENLQRRLQACKRLCRQSFQEEKAITSTQRYENLPGHFLTLSVDFGPHGTGVVMIPGKFAQSAASDGQ